MKKPRKDQVSLLRQKNRLLKKQLRELQEQYDSLLWEYKQLQYWR